ERQRVDRNGQAIGALLDRCEVALRGDDAAEASTLLGQAEARTAEGGADPFAARLARCRADLDVLTELDRIDERRWSTAATGRPGGRPCSRPPGPPSCSASRTPSRPAGDSRSCGRPTSSDPPTCTS